MHQEIRHRQEITQRCLLNTDWVGLTLHIDTQPKGAPDGYQWRVYENGTNVWKSRRVLYTDRGDKVCTLLSEPKSPQIPPQSALLEIGNEWLYHGIGVRGIEDVLRKCMIYTVRGFSRLDLAVDFVPTAGQIETINKLADGRRYVQGKRCGSGFWSVNREQWLPPQYVGVRIPHCISWGHKTSDVKWKCYYKSKELRDAAGGMGWDKPYIVDQWREAGFEIDNVWRLEVSMKKCNALLHDGRQLSQDEWGNYTVALFRDLYTSRFVVRNEEGHKDRSNDSVVEFLPISGLGSVRCRTYDSDRQHNGRIALLRQLVKSLDCEEVLLDAQTREGVLEHMGQIIRRDGLRNYFRAMVGEYFEEYAEYIRQNAGGLQACRGRYDILRESDSGKGLSPNAGFDDRKESHRPVDIVLPDTIVNWKQNTENQWNNRWNLEFGE